MRWRGAALAVAATLMLSSCGAGEAIQAKSVSAAPTSTPSASAESTATASTDAESGTVTEHMDANKMPPKPAPPVRVELPSVAKTQTKSGAMAATVGFFKELEYLQATGDISFFESVVALDTCTECKRMSDGAVKAYKAGRYAIIEPNILSNLVVESFETDLARVSLDLVMPGVVSYFPQQSRVSRFAEYRGVAVVDVQWIANRWVVTNFEGVEE